jgi:hypothetical protein
MRGLIVAVVAVAPEEVAAGVRVAMDEPVVAADAFDLAAEVPRLWLLRWLPPITTGSLKIKPKMQRQASKPILWTAASGHTELRIFAFLQFRSTRDDLRSCHVLWLFASLAAHGSVAREFGGMVRDDLKASQPQPPAKKTFDFVSSPWPQAEASDNRPTIGQGVVLPKAVATVRGSAIVTPDGIIEMTFWKSL